MREHINTTDESSPDHTPPPQPIPLDTIRTPNPSKSPPRKCQRCHAPITVGTTCPECLEKLRTQYEQSDET